MYLGGHINHQVIKKTKRVMVIVVNSFAEYQAFEGKEIGSSEWHKIDQAQINKFADATLDHQWIHY